MDSDLEKHNWLYGYWQLAARAINSIFRRWRITANERWNTTGDLCSGIASDSSTPLDYSPGIQCDCSYNSSTICHIYSLFVSSFFSLVFPQHQLAVNWCYNFVQESVFDVGLGLIFKCCGWATGGALDFDLPDFSVCISLYFESFSP